MSIPCRFPSADEARKAGWFSRRHQTSGEHRAAQEAYREKKAKKGQPRAARAPLR